MGILKFLFIAFLVAIIVPIIRVVLALWRMRRNFRRAMDGANRQAQGNRSREESPSSRKVYPKNVGEYVSFEEVAVEETNDDINGRRTTTEARFAEESQISDVEYEEIK